MGKVLGIDYGEKRIGLALSSDDWLHAFHVRTVQQDDHKQIINELSAVCTEENVDTVVIGLPLESDGSKGDKALETERFGSQIAKELQVDVVYEDERLTSVMAQKLMTSVGKSERKMRGSLDEHAAQLILQSYLDRKHGKVS